MNNLKNITILYVEDEKTIRKANASLLKTKFKKVYTALDGADGIKKFEQYNDEIDLIISDISMPIMNGLDMIEKIKMMYLRKKISFILVTSYTDKNYLLKAIKLGASDYIEKPINIGALLEKANEIFNNDIILNIVKLYDDFNYCFKEKIIKKENNIINLTNDEILLLEFLINNKNEIVKHETLQKAFTDKNISMDALRSIVKRIRQKTTKDLIITLSCVGYKVNV